ncbi:MAG: diphthamide biosynthesis enzyme Dph2 [Candidatus Methanomethylophilaceae archaeon]|jgi:2-(3-amino-3-carboxypropyl)histidine synthase
MFDLKLEHIAAWIRDRGFASVALQLPEGLKLRATEIVDFLSRKTEARFIILGDPCYGACDLFVNYKDIADALVHFGHSPIPSQGEDENVLYIEAFYSADIRESVKKIASKLPNSIGLLATVQYIQCIPQAKEVLESLGKEVHIGVGDKRTLYPGQVLGCNCSSAEIVVDKVDGFLYIGEGDFHPLAAAFGVGKEIFVLNPMNGELRSVDDVKDRILRKRFAAIESARNAQSFLVIVSSKIGQNRNALADELIEVIRKKGKVAYKSYMNELSPQNLLSYHVDVYVNTACPRLAMDDYSRYDKTILTPSEVEVVLGIRKWEDYAFDTIRP